MRDAKTSAAPNPPGLARESVVIITASGDAGCGKTWLIDTIGHMLALRGATVAEGPGAHALTVHLHEGMKG